MERVINVITLDIKKRKFLRGLIIWLLCMVGISYLIYGLASTYSETDISMLSSTFRSLIPYIILVISSFSLTQEFANKTDKIVFSGIFTRNEIMLSKLMSFIFVSVISFVFYEVISLIGNTFDLKKELISLYTFLIYAFTIGSFILLVSTITSNFIVTGIVTYVLHFDLILVLFNQALSSSKNEMIKSLIVKLPFYIANTGFSLGKYTASQSIIMIGSGVLFFVTTCVIINRKNM